MVVKKIFDLKIDDEVHSDFLKFGRGEYKDKYLLEAKLQAKGYSVKAGAEFANFLVKKCLEKVSGKIEVKGIIVSTMDLRDEINFDIIKAGNFQGIRKLQINTGVDVDEILNLMEKYPRVFFALSFKGDDFVLKIKAKAPKSGKPGKGSSEGPKADFCSLKTKGGEIISELFFDCLEFKEVTIKHDINVTDIVYPEGFETMKPADVREKSKRKGKLIRRCVVDGKEMINSADFVA